MKNYEFEELNDIVKEVFSNYRRDAEKIGENNMHALSRFFVDYDCVIKEGFCEAVIICSMLCIELSIVKQKTLSKNHYEKIMKVLQLYDSSKMIDSISEDEIETLNMQVKRASNIISLIKII